MNLTAIENSFVKRQFEILLDCEASENLNRLYL